MALGQMGETVCALTLRHAGRRVSPHPFRDIVAYTWLKEHPKDFLTLSKMLWHSNINTTLQIYGSRFNESSGVCATESWLDGREAKSK
jgi:integrase